MIVYYCDSCQIEWRHDELIRKLGGQLCPRCRKVLKR